MDAFQEFLSWTWTRHHNPLSWYLRPLFVLPFCYFAYKKNLTGILLTVLAVLSSMFWFPAPAVDDPRAAAFLAMEREYIAGPWGWAKTAMTALVPLWFVVLATAFWRRSWIVGVAVINLGALLKVIWSFFFAGESAWSIIPAVSIGALVINGGLYVAYSRICRRA